MLPESVSCCSDDIGHLKGGPTHRWISLLERFTPACLAASATAFQTIFSVMGTSARQLLTVPGNRYVLGFIQRQYSRRVSSSFGVNRTSRSRPPLPWRT